MKNIALYVTIICFIKDAFALFTIYMEEKCGHTILVDVFGAHAGKLKPSRKSRYSHNMKCAVTIETAVTHQFIVVFSKLDIEYEPFCDDDFLQFFDGNSTESDLLPKIPKRICGEDKPAGSYITTSNYLTVLFKSDSWYNENGFEIIFTIFHKGSCVEGEFHCVNGRCIATHLRCDGWNNCGDHSDECRISADTVIAILCSILVVTLILIGTMVLCRRFKKSKTKSPPEDHKTQALHDHIHDMHERSQSVVESTGSQEDLPEKIFVVKTAEGIPF